jgi:hypothetical protein
MLVERPAGSTEAPDVEVDASLVSKIEPSKIVDWLATKQTRYYTLWTVYTVAQFTAASFGLSRDVLALNVALAVVAGFWAFNIGHLGFVLECLVQTNNLRAALDAALIEGATSNSEKYQAAVRLALSNMREGRLFWRRIPAANRRVYFTNISVHLFIDVCASIALFLRVAP